MSADPLAVADCWEKTLRTLEQIGAAVESERPGLAFFALDGLRGIHGGSDELVLAAARRALDRPARLAAAQSRFCAHAAALLTRPRRTTIVRGSAREYLAPQPVALLRNRAQTEALVTTLERLGITTLGELTSLGRAALADRFGRPGIEAHLLACGEDEQPRPRASEEPLEESFEPVSYTHLDVYKRQLPANRQARTAQAAAFRVAAGQVRGDDSFATKGSVRKAPPLTLASRDEQLRRRGLRRWQRLSRTPGGDRWSAHADSRSRRLRLIATPKMPRPLPATWNPPRMYRPTDGLRR